MIAPELLGYGDTEKPEAVEAYSLKNVSNVLVGILNHEEIVEPVIVLGHDFGTTSSFLSKPILEVIFGDRIRGCRSFHSVQSHSGQGIDIARSSRPSLNASGAHCSRSCAERPLVISRPPANHSIPTLRVYWRLPTAAMKTLALSNSYLAPMPLKSLRIM